MRKKRDYNSNNVCLFPPQQHDSDEGLGVINVTYENNWPKTDKFVTGAMFKLCLIAGGKGVFRTLNNTYNLKKGDVFIVLPATMHYISNVDNLRFMYVKFSSTKAYKIFDELGINKNNCYFKSSANLASIWESCFTNENCNASLTGEGLIYLTLANITTKNPLDDIKNDPTAIANQILKIIEANYCDCNFNLTVLAEKLYFNPKYLSNLFKKLFNVNFSTYLTELRINNVQNLITSGFTSVKEIAQLSGYSDQLYFSKVFKKIHNTSPSAYILNKQNSKNHINK